MIEIVPIKDEFYIEKSEWDKFVDSSDVKIKEDKIKIISVKSPECKYMFMPYKNVYVGYGPIWSRVLMMEELKGLFFKVKDWI